MSFTCRQCGKCCKDLLQNDRSILRGLTLLPEEIHVFPAKNIKPYLGVGKRPHDQRFKIVSYQLTTETCLYLMENKCTHYNERPVTCRQFPFSLDLDPEEGVLLGIDMNCPEAVELVNESDGNIEFPDRDSAEKLLALKQLALVNPRRVWIFDLGSEKWARYDKVG